MLSPKCIEVFCGTGGVGKTTLAASRALSLASAGKKVLVITIDPSKRLKQLLGLEEERAGEVMDISNQFGLDEGLLKAQLMSPRATFQNIALRHDLKAHEENHILKTLLKPYGGMNEILSVIELNHHFKSKEFDTIILDTPPGKHFIDFLKATEKINQFFDKTYLEIFRFLGKKVNKKMEGAKGVVQALVSSGIKKLLSYLENVTGKEFVEEFIDTIALIYEVKSEFLEALDLREVLADSKSSTWFLVSSIEQDKIKDVLAMMGESQSFLHEESFLLINRCLGKALAAWEIKADDETLIKYKEKIQSRETQLKKLGRDHFKDIIEFPEVVNTSPLEHVIELAKGW